MLKTTVSDDTDTWTFLDIHYLHTGLTTHRLAVKLLFAIPRK
jgi:hypothetical protein